MWHLANQFYNLLQSHLLFFWESKQRHGQGQWFMWNGCVEIHPSPKLSSSNWFGEGNNSNNLTKNIRDQLLWIVFSLLLQWPPIEKTRTMVSFANIGVSITVIVVFVLSLVNHCTPGFNCIIRGRVSSMWDFFEVETYGERSSSQPMVQPQCQTAATLVLLSLMRGSC